MKSLLLVAGLSLAGCHYGARLVPQQFEMAEEYCQSHGGLKEIYHAHTEIIEYTGYWELRVGGVCQNLDMFKLSARVKK